MNERASTPGAAASAAVSSLAVSKVIPAAGVSVRSASKAPPICRMRLSKPLKTESRMSIAATGMATATTLSPAMRLMTEWDLGAKR